MPARIAVVLDEPELTEKIVGAIKAKGHDAAALPDAMTALNAFWGETSIDVLVTSLNHGKGQPNGIALARIAKAKKPGVKVLFVGDTGLAHHAAGLGTYLGTRVSIEHVVGHALGSLDR